MLSRNIKFFGRKYKVYNFRTDKEYLNNKAKELYVANKKELSKNKVISNLKEEINDRDIILFNGHPSVKEFEGMMKIAQAFPNNIFLFYTKYDFYPKQYPPNFIVRFLGRENPYNEEIDIEYNCPKFDKAVFPCSLCRACLKLRPNLAPSVREYFD